MKTFIKNFSEATISVNWLKHRNKKKLCLASLACAWEHIISCYFFIRIRRTLIGMALSLGKFRKMPLAPAYFIRKVINNQN